MTVRAMGSVAGYCDPALRGFSTGGFHRFFATKPVSSLNQQAERWSGGDHGSIWDSWPIAFLVGSGQPINRCLPSMHLSQVSPFDWQEAACGYQVSTRERCNKKQSVIISKDAAPIMSFPMKNPTIGTVNTA